MGRFRQSPLSFHAESRNNYNCFRSMTALLYLRLYRQQLHTADSQTLPEPGVGIHIERLRLSRNQAVPDDLFGAAGPGCEFQAESGFVDVFIKTGGNLTGDGG